ncbi:putative B3 domain-containing protein-like [Capsicum annuum]|nr:putative B3 domain-containing protein-like [Capsicum annuum]
MCALDKPLVDSQQVTSGVFNRTRQAWCDRLDSKALPENRSPGLKMKLKVVWRKVSDYVRYDLKEIAFPSSLPNPPHFKKRRKLTMKERYLVLKEASRLYAASWVRDIGPELRPNDYKKKRETEAELGEESGNRKEKEPSTLEDLAVAARGGMETLRPALQRVYMTRASAYKDALKSFIQGYQEGIQQTMEKTKDEKSSKDPDAPNSKRPT